MASKPCQNLLLSSRFSRPSSVLSHRQPIRLTSRCPRRYYSDGSDEKPDFKGQLYESTALRVKREKAQQQRHAEMRVQQASEKAATSPWQYGLLITLFTLAGLGFGYNYGSTSNPPNSDSSTLPLSETRPPDLNTDATSLQAAWAEIRSIVGPEHISTDHDDIIAHAGSYWSSHKPEDPNADNPFMIVRPASTEEVSAIMKVCHARRIPVTAYSGGTSLEGHFAATRGGVTVDFIRMDKILALNKEDLDVVVQPAVGWEALNDVIGDDGLMFPPDPGPGAMIGGMVGTGCSGTNAYRYGTMREWVLSLTVVLADGTIVKTRQRPRKSSAGYDLTKLFIGSEGTLGLVTEATLKLTVKPQNTSVAVCSFGSVRQAADCVFSVVGAGVPIAAIEILDDEQMKCINDAGMTSRQWKEAPTLFFKFAGTSSSVKEHIAIVQKLAKSTGSKSFEFAKNDDEANELWSARKEALWSVVAKKRSLDDRVWTTDVAVPISKLATIIEETKDDMKASEILGTIVGHVGDGNFHAILIYNAKEQQAVSGLVHRMVKRAIELEGTATGEHGVGLVKRDYLNHELGETTVDLMRKVRGFRVCHRWCARRTCRLLDRRP
ncbi:glycolate oxidase [Eremomyces bilateralis CBS 781.70]|uniref:Glycolate oxidase n=1 Tax=Eremomyces bilateralis CBS 781.70 TaxID=1392243 RepID=A0A6G1G792_9PEZI|nr:glycolate oxidase [Eremomyces bilateralis CBS 781.70]KAF1813918.1 glycolate oxidase [Eremomyces bilateralis CBS 781.70]